VLLVAGGLALLGSFGGDRVAPINEPTATTIPTPTTIPATTLPAPEPVATTPDPQTTLPVAIAPAPPDTFDRLDDALAHAPVYHIYGYEVTAQLEYLDAYIEGLTGSSVWPEPEFDTSTLGTESVLIELPPSALTSVSRIIPGLTEDDQPVIEQPLVAGAQLSGTEHAAAYSIGLGFKDGTVSPNWKLLITRSYKQGTVLEDYGELQWDGYGRWDNDPPHIILMHGDWYEDSPGDYREDSPTVIGGLPPEASVVATTLEDGTKVWQRTISGIAIFSDPSSQCDPSDNPPPCSAEYIVMNANGNEILRLRWADLDLLPLGFTVSGP
jgi:hypothetical protein